MVQRHVDANALTRAHIPTDEVGNDLYTTRPQSQN